MVWDFTIRKKGERRREERRKGGRGGKGKKEGRMGGVIIVLKFLHSVVPLSSSKHQMIFKLRD